jgi:pimeloyl-ACP methyl ester carboxylesterase
VPEVVTTDAVLHVEVDGEGEPVTVLAHGITNTCRELSQLTPLFPGSKVRFCFRGHGHSSAPERGYAFADFARDIDEVAKAYGASRGVGTSLGQAAMCTLLSQDPDRFERLVFLLPGGIDHEFEHKEKYLRMADLLSTLPPDQAIETILNDPERTAGYVRSPWLREIDRMLWSEQNPIGLARAIREVVNDVPLRDAEILRQVTAPALIIAREGDPIHPAKVALRLADLMPRSELHMFHDEVEMFDAMPRLVMRVNEFLFG